MKTKSKIKRIIALVLTAALFFGMAPAGKASADKSYSVSLTSLGRRGTVSFGSKSKSGNWWQMHIDKKKAFCLDLGDTCHSGNTYAAQETHHWDQDTGGAKNGYYAKIVRWYVIEKKRSNKGYILAQSLIWSVENGRNSEEQLRDVIRQVQGNTGVSASKSANELYGDIFRPDGNWTADLTFWQKTGNSRKYQRLMTVDAEELPTEYKPEKVHDSTLYRQRVTVMKKDEDGKGLGGIQFTLSAHNLDDLYSFAVTDRDGTETNSADEDSDTSFEMTGHTTDGGKIGFRMTYRLSTMDYYYYPEADLAAMSDSEKKAAKKFLTDDMDLDEGADFAPGMTKAGAEKLMEKEMKGMKDEISNTYTLTEDNTGSRKDLIVDPKLAKGVKITLKKADSWERDDDGQWPDSQAEKPSEYGRAYITGVTNQYKKASIRIIKKDSHSKDGKAHGEAELEGAEFRLYADKECKKTATVYDAKGNAKEAGAYVIKDGQAVTDYLRSGVTYYLKETKAPKGYVLSTEAFPVEADASGKTVEFSKEVSKVEVGNKPVLGKVAIQKYYVDGKGGQKTEEPDATFQIYLTSKGGYDACGEQERDTIRTDAKGYAVTKELYFGKYTVHQVDSGGVDAYPVADFQVDVTEDGKTYTYPLENMLFKAYLKLLKSDGNTGKQVLKPGTAYQIYKVTDKGEELVEQETGSGNKKEKVSRFLCDAHGEIMTAEELKSGTYRIYEVDSAEGLHITQKYMEVTLDSHSDNYESYTDDEGCRHAVVTVTYTNEETYGKLKVCKTGETLSDFRDGKFVYEKRFLKGVVFEVYAKEDIVTQDNQGTHWYEKGGLVATITTGKGAEFQKECKNITGHSMDKDGTVAVNLPLGKYEVREKQTLYGYVLPDKSWDIEFDWKNKEEEFVLNATDDTDKDGVLRVENARAKAAVSLIKTDAESGKPVKGAEFGIYTKHDIFNADGEKIAEAGTLLEKITTDGKGKAASKLDLPLMGEGYAGEGAGPSPEPTASIGEPPVLMSATAKKAPEQGAEPETAPDGMKNSGTYYLKELSAPEGYYVDGTEHPVHLEYRDQRTEVIAAEVRAEDAQTTVTVSKTDVTGSKEIAGCRLKITDEKGKTIVKWTSGDRKSVKINGKAEQTGYRNLSARFQKDGALRIDGLFHDVTYTLAETRPADGYVTAESIRFQLVEGEKNATVVFVFQGDDLVRQKEGVVRMADDTTKIRLIKLGSDTGQGLRGAKFVVYDKAGKKVFQFTSREEGYDITGILAIGETYTFKEIEAPKGYKLAKPVKYTVKDTGGLQKVSITDKKTHKPHVPQTGGNTTAAAGIALVLLAGCGLWIFRRKKVRL